MEKQKSGMSTKETNKVIETMFQMQFDLNNLINGSGWMLKDITKDGREINWNRCIYMECMKLIDNSFNWKHWKERNNGTDDENFVIDVVDIINIWHFVMIDILPTPKGGGF